MSRFLETFADMNVNYTAAGYGLKMNSLCQNFFLYSSPFLLASSPSYPIKKNTVKIGESIQELNIHTYAISNVLSN